jgi:hypothetical protein
MDEAAYLLTFNIGIYHYTYKITNLDDNSFSGSYTCVANGVTVAMNQPVCGVRYGSGLACNLSKIDASRSTPDSHVIVSLSGNGIKNSKSFTADGPWEVQWNTNSDSGISIYLYDATNGEIIENLASQPGPGEGSSYYPQPGQYYLSIISGGAWEIKIIQQTID